MRSKVTGALLLCALITLQYSTSCGCDHDEIASDNNQDKSKTCIVWDGINVKTFNGNVYSYKSTCSYTLASFKVIGAQFEVIFHQNPYSLLIKYNGNYEIKQSGSSTVFLKNGRSYNIPTSLDGIIISQPGNLVVVNIPDLGLKIKWDKSDTAEIIVNDQHRAISGLCGDNSRAKQFHDLIARSGERANSILDFADSWSEGGCKARASANACGSRQALLLKAESHCKSLFTDAKFQSCQDEYNAFMSMCTSNYCSCTERDRNDCMCKMLDVFVRTCRVNKRLEFINWRDAKLCRKRCSNPDQEYMSCAPNKRQLSCGEDSGVNTVDECEEGCYCPQGLRLFRDKCLLLDECPCIYNGEHAPNSVITQECKQCTCTKGRWICPNKICTVTADCWGDPHYTTFDGKKYDFMGKCMYYVVRGFGYDVICDHYVLKGSAFVKDFQSPLPSWCRRVIIKASDEEIELGHKHEVKVNGRRLTYLPTKLSGILISKPSSEFVSVQLENNVEIKFNGEARVIVTIPTTMKGRVRGLFGTYTKDQADDFLLPDGTTVTDPNIFGHSWKVPGSCTNEFTGVIPHPCIANPAMKPLAEKACSLLKSPTFAGCSKNPEEDYESCLYDACACTANPQKCACDPLAIQADKCADKGKYIEWRQKIPECAIKCPAGQEYKVCGNSCTRSCDDIALNPICQTSCIEGCRCPEGKALNENNVCVPVNECKCRLQQGCYPPGFKYRNDKKIRTCKDAKWIEKDASGDEQKTIPDIKDLRTKCKREDFLEFTGCKASNPVTCYNMHTNNRPIYDNCKEGCQCIDGFVLDTTTNTCTRPDDCPCLHNGISYKENAIRRDRSQKCTCKDSIWKCVQEIQPWEKCSVWGNIHIRLFNGALYSFTGNCEYTLFEDISRERIIRITLKTEKCNTGSCIKYVRIQYNSESIQMNTGGEPIITGNLDNLLIASYDFSTIVDVKDKGLKLAWNKNGWAHIHVRNSWKAKHQYGLCGSYNDHKVNDFALPEGTGVSYLVNYWRQNKECPKAVERPVIPSGNLILPEYTCDALFDEAFQLCRAVIPVEEYYKRCLIEANDLLLTQNSGDDYHCSTLSAYAQECNDLGVLVNWRKDNICPIRCQKGMQYNQCILGKDGVCYEGCEAREGTGANKFGEHTSIRLVCNDANKPCKKTVEINIEGDGVCNEHNQYTLVFNVGGKSTAVAGLAK